VRRLLMLSLVFAGFGSLLAACGNNAAMTEKYQKYLQRQAAAQSGLGKHFDGVDDKARIAYVAIADGQAQIFTIQPDGTQPLQITRDPGYKCKPAWSVDHKHLAYFQFKSDRPMGDTVSVVILDSQGNTREMLSDKRVDLSMARINWKPDGSVLYFLEKDFPTALTGYDTTTGAPVETLRLPKSKFMNRILSVSHSMKILAGDGPTQPGNINHLGVIATDGKGEFDMVAPFVKGEMHYGPITWSYDSQMVAFDFDKSVIVMSSSISMAFKVFPLAPQDFDAQLSSATFSPTGAQVACIMEKVKEGNVGSGDQEVTSDVWVMNVNGSQQKKITNTGSCFDPAW